MKRFIKVMLSAALVAAAASCQLIEPEEGEIIYPIGGGGTTYAIGAHIIGIMDMDSYAYTVAQNCLDFPVTLNIGRYEYRGGIKEWAISSYQVLPDEEVRFVWSIDGGDSFVYAPYFSIDFGPYGTLSQFFEEEWAPWYYYFMHNYYEDEVYNYKSYRHNGKNYKLAYKVGYDTFPIDEKLLKFLATE